jgi:amidase
MSIFSLDTKQGNPVTTETLDGLCSQLNVQIEEHEKEDYRRLLAVFHDASEQLMGMKGEQHPSHLRGVELIGH